MGRYFGTDGFRGEAGAGITCVHAYKAGRFLGWYFGERKGGFCRAVIGKDSRRSSYMLEYALASGIAESGGDAYIMHVTTTPSVSFAARVGGFDCGVMISASHNPYYDNGIKIFNRLGEKADDALLSGIEDYFDGEIDDLPRARGAKIGRTVDYVSGRNRYIGHLIALAANSYKGLKIGLDCANGSAWHIAPSVFGALGAQIYCIGNAPDGLNVNEGCGSTKPKKLQKLVKDNGLDIGFAFDGDADRCLCVDEKGELIDGDGEIFILADRLLKAGGLHGGAVVGTVASNGGLARSLKARGVNFYAADVGDRHVYEKMTEVNAAVGGEPSGHIIFGKLESTGDGLVTAINICEALCEGKCACSRLLKGYAPMPQACESVKVGRRQKVMQDKIFTAAVNAARLHMNEGGRVVVRPSGTEEVVRVLVESESREEAARICAELAAEVIAADGR